MKFITTDALGQIKVVQVPKEAESTNRGHIKSYGKPLQMNGIQAMTVFQDYEGELNIAVAKGIGYVEAYLLSDLEEAWFRYQVEDDGYFVNLEYRQGVFIASLNTGVIIILDGASGTLQNTMKLDGPISMCRCHPRVPGVLAYAGEENDLTIMELNNHHQSFDMGNIKTLFTSQNAKNDRLDQRMPVLVTDFTFPSGSGLGYSIAAVTSHGQVKLYDSDSSQKPIVDVSVSQRPLLGVIPGLTDEEIIFYDSKSAIYRFSLSLKRPVATFKGGPNGITDLYLKRDPFEFIRNEDDKKDVTPRPIVLASVDETVRLLTIWDYNSRKVVTRIKLVAKLTGVCCLDSVEETDEAEKGVNPNTKEGFQIGSLDESEDDFF